MVRVKTQERSGGTFSDIYIKDREEVTSEDSFGEEGRHSEEGVITTCWKWDITFVASIDLGFVVANALSNHWSGQYVYRFLLEEDTGEFVKIMVIDLKVDTKGTEMSGVWGMGGESDGTTIVG